jgi:hypothetical protein
LTESVASACSPHEARQERYLARMSDGHFCIIRDLGPVKGGKGLKHHEVVVDFSWRALTGFVLLRRRRKPLQTLQTEISHRTATMGQKLKPRLVAASAPGQAATLGRSATLIRPS